MLFFISFILIYPSIALSFYLSTIFLDKSRYLSIYLSIYLSFHLCLCIISHDGSMYGKQMLTKLGFLLMVNVTQWCPFGKNSGRGRRPVTGIPSNWGIYDITYGSIMAFATWRCNRSTPGSAPEGHRIHSRWCRIRRRVLARQHALQQKGGDDASKMVGSPWKMVVSPETLVIWPWKMIV